MGTAPAGKRGLDAGESEAQRKERKRRKKEARKAAALAAAGAPAPTALAATAPAAAPEAEARGARKGKGKEKGEKQRRKGKDGDRAASATAGAHHAHGDDTLSAPRAATSAPADARAELDRRYRAEHEISAGEGASADELPPCVRSFDDAPFAAPLVARLRAAGFAQPTPIQAQGWPVVASGADLIAVAKTGSGKTLAFLLPALHALGAHDAPRADAAGPPAPRALVLAPTRELAQQTSVAAEQYGGAVGLRSVCVYGGVPTGPQRAALAAQRPHVLLATPGRLVDLLGARALSLGAILFFILDEADRMLDMGFEPQLREVLGALPGARQTLCFSATWPRAVRKLAAAFLRAAATVTLFLGGGADAELEANRAVSQAFVHATDDEKEKKLYEYLCGLGEGSRVVVFANTKRRAEALATRFWHEGFGTCAIHGDKRQQERDAALAKFVAQECPLMFATDVAARGLDIKGVSHVVNFDMAKDVASYVHRIGRTGRAGELGAALTFWNPDYDKECAPALVRIARDAGQPVPDWLAKFEKARPSKQWKVDDASIATLGATPAPA